MIARPVRTYSWAVRHSRMRWLGAVQKAQPMGRGQKNADASALGKGMEGVAAVGQDCAVDEGGHQEKPPAITETSLTPDYR